MINYNYHLYSGFMHINIYYSIRDYFFTNIKSGYAVKLIFKIEYFQRIAFLENFAIKPKTNNDEQ